MSLIYHAMYKDENIGVLAEVGGCEGVVYNPIVISYLGFALSKYALNFYVEKNSNGCP